MSGFLPDYTRRRDQGVAEFRTAARRAAARHHHPALHRHADRAVGRGLAVRSGQRGLVALPRLRRRIGGADGARKRPRLACRPRLVARPRATSIPARSASRWSIPGTLRLSGFRARPDRCGDRALPRHSRASFDRARAGAGAFGHGARPQDRSGREVSVGAAACRGCRPLRRTVADPRRPLPQRSASAANRSRPCSRCLRSTDTASRSPGRSTRPPRWWSPPSSGISGPGGSTVSPTARPSRRCIGCWPPCHLT